jgi:hypothetical protein
MAGYSVDILFSIIDRVKNVLVPPVEQIQAAANPDQPPTATPTPTPQQPAAPDKPDKPEKPEGGQKPEVEVVNRIEVKPVGVVTEEEEEKD